MGRRVDQRKADVGKAIVFLADRCGMSQAQLAKKAGVSPKAITDWKHGKSSPSPQPLAAVLKALGCTQDVLDQATDLFNWWRFKMQSPVDPTFEIMEALGSPDSAGPTGPAPRGGPRSPGPSGLPASSAVDEHHREVGRTVERLYHLLSPRPDSKARRPL